MKDEAYPFHKLIVIFILVLLYAVFFIIHLYLMEQRKNVSLEISTTQDRIKSINSQISKWTNDANMIHEAKKLKLRKMEEGEVVVLHDETDS